MLPKGISSFSVNHVREHMISIYLVVSANFGVCIFLFFKCKQVGADSRRFHSSSGLSNPAAVGTVWGRGMMGHGVTWTPAWGQQPSGSRGMPLFSCQRSAHHSCQSLISFLFSLGYPDLQRAEQSGLSQQVCPGLPGHGQSGEPQRGLQHHCPAPSHLYTGHFGLLFR